MNGSFVDLAQTVPDLYAEACYAGSANLTGHPLAGYRAAKALATREAAAALRRAARIAAWFGCTLWVFDAYRPESAVRDLVAWAAAPEDKLTKADYYPKVEKDQLIPLGYIADRSAHSRGSTIDLALARHGVPLDYGTHFDFMDESSHHGVRAFPIRIRARRVMLRLLMRLCGFAAYQNEWWHYRLRKEPYPDTSFDFPIE